MGKPAGYRGGTTEQFVDSSGPDAGEKSERADADAHGRGAGGIDALFESSDALRNLLQLCLWHLGGYATDCDAEVTLYNFDAKHRLKVIRSYKPGKQSLVQYYKLCLIRFCWREGRKLRRMQQESFDAALADGQEFEDENEGQPTDDRLRDEAEWRSSESEKSRMRDAANQLSSADRDLVRMYYHEGLRIKEIAIRTGRKESWIKVKLFRIRGHLKTLLEQES